MVPWVKGIKMIQLYANHDYDKTKHGMFPVTPEKAKELNKQGYGIHWTPQVFKDGKRTLENLQEIRYWVADIDTGDKDTMIRRIATLPICPTFVVETKRGYHCYWRAKDATKENYETIERGISEALCADGSLVTPTHTLRFPGFYHLKDPKNPFLIQIVWKKPEAIYSEGVMLRSFKPKPKFQWKNRYLEPDNDKLLEIIKPENWVKYLHTNEISSGNRNNGLNKIAYKLKQMGADANLVFQVLQDINQTLNPPLDYAELRSIVKGKFK